MEKLVNVNFDSLKIGERYFGANDYEIYTCISVNNTLENNGFNQYYKTATFDVHSKYGRFINREVKTFYVELN
jgi:hypothetical protein